MAKKTKDKKKAFEEAPEDSWWVCLSSDCNRAYQKYEAINPGICPYCHGEDYNHMPWDSAMLNNADLPHVPETGHTYSQIVQ